MKEPKAMAYVNMYGVLACLENLCEIDDEAKAIVKSLKKPVSLCFDVANGPCCTFHFTQDGCTISEGRYGCTCKMNFASPEKFNALIDDNKPGMPTKNVPQVLSFLLGVCLTIFLYRLKDRHRTDLSRNDRGDADGAGENEKKEQKKDDEF